MHLKILLNSLKLSYYKINNQIMNLLKKNFYRFIYFINDRYRFYWYIWLH